MDKHSKTTFVIRYLKYVVYFLSYGLWKLAYQLARGNVSRGELLSMIIRAPRDHGCRPVNFIGPGYQPKKSSHFRKHHRGGRKHHKRFDNNHDRY